MTTDTPNTDPPADTLPALRAPTAVATLGAPRSGLSVAHAEQVLDLAPREALTTVLGAIERHARASGHRQGDAAADLVDERGGLTYRIQVAPEGAATAVRVDVDPSQARARRLLWAGAFGLVTALTLGAGWALSSTWALLAAGVMAAGVGVYVAASRGAERNAIRQAHAVAARALADAEASAPNALPPAD